MLFESDKVSALAVVMRCEPSIPDGVLSSRRWPSPVRGYYQPLWEERAQRLTMCDVIAEMKRLTSAGTIPFETNTVRCRLKKGKQIYFPYGR
jgi:hypothetical protein